MDWYRKGTLQYGFRAVALQNIPFGDTQGADGLPLYADANNLVWMGGQQFVWLYDQGAQQYLPAKIPVEHTSQILPVHDGTVWITGLTVQHVSRYVPGRPVQTLERLIDSPQKPVFKPGFFVMTTLEDKFVINGLVCIYRA